MLITCVHCGQSFNAKTLDHLVFPPKVKNNEKDRCRFLRLIKQPLLTSAPLF